MLDLTEYWLDYPPVQTMVQAYLKLTPRTEQRMPTTEECSSFLALMPHIPFQE